MNQSTSLKLENPDPRVSKSRKRIFYVEDDKDSADMMNILLTGEGYEVIIATSLQEGTEIIRRGAFDLFLLDNWLGEGSGIELCKTIRAFDTSTPIVFYAGAVYD